MATVAEMLVSMLADAGVRRIYGVVGDSLNSVVDAVRRNGNIRWIQVRHEETGAFAAGAEAQLTGNLAVCAGSCGPGHVHLVNGLYDAHRSAAPVLAIAAHIPSSEIGTSYFQETHPERLFVECSHYCELISNANQMPRVPQIAMQTAIAKGGVAVIALPGDVAMQKAPDSPLRHNLAAIRARVTPCAGELEELARMINSSESVTLLCGAGCAGAHDEVVQLATLLKAPVVHSLRGKDRVEYDNPNDVGMTGLIGFASGYLAMQTCDLLLMLGTDFPYEKFYPTETKIAQIDIRPEHLGRRSRLDLGLVGDISETLRVLMPKLKGDRDGRHLERSLRDYAESRKKLDRHVENLHTHRPIHPDYLAASISEFAADNAVFTADTGMCSVWGARYLQMKKGRALLASFNHGSMANALPQAIGAQLLDPDRQVVCMSGDGGLGMLMGDLLTVAQYELPVKIVVFNNSTLGMVKLEMQVAGLPDYATDFKHFNFANIASACGIQSLRVEEPGDVRDAVQQAIESKGPILVDAVTNPYELSMPPKVTREMAWGFSLFMLREIMAGNTVELLDEIRSNL
jgi:pyruvate dehydrogenase (quinone)